MNQPKTAGAKTASSNPPVATPDSSRLGRVRHRFLCSADLHELLEALFELTNQEIGIEGMAYHYEEATFSWKVGLPGTHSAEYLLNTTAGCQGRLRIARSRKRFTEDELERFEQILAAALPSLQYQWMQESARRAPRVQNSEGSGAANLYDCLHEFCSQEFEEVSPVAILLIEISHLEKLRGVHGETATEELHRRVAAYLQDHMQSCDTVYRVGRGQIAIVMNSASEKRIQLVNQLVQILTGGKVFSIGESETEVQLTVGTIRLEKRDTPRKLLDRAQLALALARQSIVNPSFFLPGKWSARRDSAA